MISLIVAMTENRVIGYQGDMPWRMSNDLRRFKRLTMGHHIVMGRKTYESIGRPLPGRVTLIISRTARMDDDRVRVARGLDNALQIAGQDEEIFVTGGAEIYSLALPVCDRIYLTRLHVELEGDVYFPEVDWSAWRLVDRESHQADDNNDHDHSFLIYDRKPSA